MGFYLNNTKAAELYRNEKKKPYFVDKTKLLAELIPLVREGTAYVAITRPRRFGKTVMANMIGAYFCKADDCSDIFDSLAIAESEFYREHLNRHNVIYIDFSKCTDNCQCYSDYIMDIQEILQDDLREAFPDVRFRTKGSVQEDLDRIFNHTKEKFIFVLDEWDSVFHKDFITEEDRKSYIGFLANLLKDQAYVSLAYMTGILPIAKYSDSSTLNNFDEYTMATDDVYSEYFGFTDCEVDDLYQRYLAREPKPNVSREDLEYWYDGYHTPKNKKMYNPRSVVYALRRNMVRNYWTATGSYAAVSDYISGNVDGIKKDIALLVSGESVDVNIQEIAAINMSLNTRDEILSAMVVYGLLNYESRSKTVRIPNKELMDEFAKVIMEDSSMGYYHELSLVSKRILEATLSGDADSVAVALTKVHNVSPIKAYNSEAELSLVVFFAYLSAIDQYEMKREEQGGKGYVDYIFHPRNLVDDGIIVELKMDKTPEEAIQQIKDKRYVRAFSGLPGEKVWHGKRVLAVGITYDSRNGDHYCKIEELPVK
ncbi:MAG: ATP-binding protein [Clostridiales bacterium]|nr:ATP-binding protein [Clostridiales bacterium]